MPIEHERLRQVKIAVNTRFLIKDKLEGIGWFTHETLSRITKAHPEHDFYFFFDRAYPDEFVFSDNVTPLVLHPPARHPFLWYIWFEIMVPLMLKKINADIFVSTDGFLSLKTKIKTLLVIHDIAFEHFPDHNKGLIGKFLKKYSPRYAKKDDRIVTVSEFSKQDIVKTYGIAPVKIDVVYNGAQEIYHPYSEQEIKPVKEKYTLAKDYFIYAGAIQPRKNISNLLKAFEAFKQKTHAETQLVLAGRKAWKFQEALEVFNNMQYKDDVKLVGHLRTDELAKMLSGAIALVYVSKFEGFGIPIVEAMSCNTAVITSNTSSMPEVGGDAALLVNPDSVAEIAGAMEKVCNEPTRTSLIEKGKAQREKFSWERTAGKFWTSIETVLNKQN